MSTKLCLTLVQFQRVFHGLPNSWTNIYHHLLNNIINIYRVVIQIKQQLKQKKSTSHISNKKNKIGISHKLLLNYAILPAKQLYFSLNIFEVLLSAFINLTCSISLVDQHLWNLVNNILTCIIIIVLWGYFTKICIHIINYILMFFVSFIFLFAFSNIYSHLSLLFCYQLSWNRIFVLASQSQKTFHLQFLQTRDIFKRYSFIVNVTRNK